jgi:PAS domain S-box-containing protein
MAKMVLSYDWDSTIVGSIDTWSPTLLTALNLLLNSSSPMFIWWNHEKLIHFYNDAYIDILGDKHPDALGRPAREVWAETWDSVGPLVEAVFKTGQPIHKKDLALVVNRHGHDETAYFTFSYSPLFDQDGTVAGLFCTVIETTNEVLTNQRLRESEARFRTLADTAPMYIAMADEDGNAVYFNKPWLDFTGMKMEQMKGLGWLATLHPEDSPRFEKDFLEAFRERIPISEEYRFKRADGQYRWMHAVGAPRFTPDRRFIGYFGTYTDFHETKEAQLALKRSEERFRTLIDKSADAVQLVSPTGEILYSSDSLKNVLGYSPDEIAHEGVTPFLHPDDKEYFFERFAYLIEHPDEQITMHYRVKHKDGSWAWLETIGVNHLATPNINALVGNFRNITAQKLAETSLRNSEKRFRVLADNIPNLAWMAKKDGHIYWYNDRWYDYTGTNPQDMEGWGWQSVHDPKTLPQVMKKWKKSLKNGQEFEMVFPIKGADGTFRPFLTRVAPLHNDAGEVEQWIGTNTDISEQLKIKVAEARTHELEAVTQTLAQQRKELLELNQAKDDFISIASHQLRTPATGVKQYLGMLLEGYAEPLTETQKAFADRAFDSNERELMIINDLLQVAQVDAGKMNIKKERIDFVGLLNEVILEQAEKFMSREQALSFRPAEKTLHGMADASRIRMVLENLVDNASKYTPHGKKITVSLARHLDTHLKISVKDEGVGIDPIGSAKIFDKFVRIDNPLSRTMGGSGLGLYLAERIVSLHGGTIYVASRPGRGSTFTILLPL